MGSPKCAWQKLFKVFLVAWYLVQILEMVDSQELLPKPEAIKIVVKHEDLILPKILTTPPTVSQTTTEKDITSSTARSSLKYSPSTIRDALKRRYKVQTPSTLEEKATVVEITDPAKHGKNATQVQLVYPINSDDYLSTVPDSLPGMNFAQLQDYKSRQQHPSSTVQTTKTTILSTISGYLDESTLSENVKSTTERSGSTFDTTLGVTSDEDSIIRRDSLEVNPTTESGSETGNRFTTRTNPSRPKLHLLQTLEPTPPTINYGLKLSPTEAEPNGIESKSFETRTFTATFRPFTTIAKTSRPSYHITTTFRPTVRPSFKSRPLPSQVPALIEDTAIFDPALSDLEELGFQSERIHMDDLLEAEPDSDESEIFTPITGTPTTTTITSNKSVLMSAPRSSTDNWEDESDNDGQTISHQNDDDLNGFKRHEANRKLEPKSSEENDPSREKEDNDVDDDNDNDMEELIRDWGESIIRSVKANNKINHTEGTSKSSRQPTRHRHRHRVHIENLDTISTTQDDNGISTEPTNRLVRQLPTTLSPTDLIKQADPAPYASTGHTRYNVPQYQSTTPRVVSSTFFNGHGIVPTNALESKSKWQGPTIPPLRRNQFNAHNYFDSSTTESETRVSLSNYLADDMDQSSQDSITKYSYKFLPHNQIPGKPKVTDSPLVSIMAQSKTSPDGLFHPEQATPLPKHRNVTLSYSHFGSKFQKDPPEKTTPVVTTFRPDFTNEYQDLRYMSNKDGSRPKKLGPSPTPSTFQIVRDFPKALRGDTFNLFRHPTRVPNLVSDSIRQDSVRKYSYRTTELPVREITQPVVKQLPSTRATLTRSPPQPDLQKLPGLRPNPKNHQPPFPALPAFVPGKQKSGVFNKTERPTLRENVEDSTEDASFQVMNKIKELKNATQKEERKFGTSLDRMKSRRKPFFPRRRYSRPKLTRSKEQKFSVGASVVTRAPDGYRIESPNLFLEVDFPANGDREATISRKDIRRVNPKRGRQRLSTIKPKIPNPTIDKLRDFSIPNFDRFETSLKERETKLNRVQVQPKRDDNDEKTGQSSPTKPTKFSFERHSYNKPIDEERFRMELREIPNIIPTDWSKPFSNKEAEKFDSTTSRTYTVPHRPSVYEPQNSPEAKESYYKPLNESQRERLFDSKLETNKLHFSRNSAQDKTLGKVSLNLEDVSKPTEIPKFTYKILEPPIKPTKLPQFTYTLLDPEKIQSSKPTRPTTYKQFKDYDNDDRESEDDFILVRDPGQRGFIEIKKEEVGSGIPADNPFTRSKSKSPSAGSQALDVQSQKVPPFLSSQPISTYKDTSFPSFFAVPSGSDSDQRKPNNREKFPSALEPQPSVHTYTKVNSPQSREETLNQYRNSIQILKENSYLKAKTRYEPIDITDVEGPPKRPKSSKTYKKYKSPPKIVTPKPYKKNPINNLPTFTLPSMTPNILKLNSEFRNQPRNVPSQQPKLQARPGLRTTEDTLDFPSDMPNPFRTDIGSNFEFLQVPSSLPRPASTAELQTIEFATRPTVLKLQPHAPTQPLGPKIEQSRPSSPQIYSPPKPYRQPSSVISATRRTTPAPQLDHVTSRSDPGDDLEYEYTGLGSDPLPKVLLANGLTVMAGLISEAGMEVRLSGPGPYTMFAPSDKAFNDFLNNYHERGVSAALEALKTNKAELIRIVQNHVVKGLVLGRDLEDDLVGTSLSGSKLRSNLYLTESQDWKEILVKTINGGIIQKTDMEASNGVIHLIDRVLFPPATQNIIQTLKSDPEGRFTTLLKALKATKLDQEISDFSTGPWTIFAPTNEAFMNLPMSELEALIQDPKKLNRLVLNHLINRSVFSAGLKPHQVIDMANGNKLNLFSRRDRVKLDGANISDMDIPAANGVIQIVENVIELKDDAQSSLESLEKTIKPGLLKPPKTPKLFKF
eukprot:TCALIF_03595-PA protein Name:"Similar to Tgfbi Transforming growth factor-beta-induced protein ig-h3 (Mus musculus)" AED:0.52 eAED:0.52 QI:7/0.6/0.33/0.66/0.8/0.66/6/0/1902